MLARERAIPLRLRRSDDCAINYHLHRCAPTVGARPLTMIESPKFTNVELSEMSSVTGVLSKDHDDILSSARYPLSYRHRCEVYLER